MARSEFEDEYDASLEGEQHKILGAILSEDLRVLDPSEPIRVSRDATVRDVIRKLTEERQGAVCVVDANGRLVGIFSERDVMTRVVAKDLDVNKTRVGDVMTAEPEALTPDHKICYALNRMSVRGFRNVPIVDGAGRPVGIVFTRHFVKFIVSLFPEAVLNLPPEPGLKHPEAAERGG